MSKIRTVTFVLEFKQKDAPKFLWENHIGKEFDFMPGIRVIGIAEGNSILELEEQDMGEEADE